MLWNYHTIFYEIKWFFKSTCRNLAVQKILGFPRQSYIVQGTPWPSVWQVPRCGLQYLSLWHRYLCKKAIYIMLSSVLVFCSTNHADIYYKTHCKNYLALSSSSRSSGTPLWTRIPRFIWAGSSAQFDMPINPTFLCGNGSSSPSHPSSNRGWRV